MYFNIFFSSSVSLDQSTSSFFKSISWGNQKHAIKITRIYVSIKLKSIKYKFKKIYIDGFQEIASFVDNIFDIFHFLKVRKLDGRLCLKGIPI